MAPFAITEDYYGILELDQTASLEVITRSYRRLALKLHPDRNSSPDATAAFQLLAKAYETLKDETERRKYDLIYQSWKSEHTRAPPKPSTTPGASAASEAAQIVKLQQSKNDRAARWRVTGVALDTSIRQMERGNLQLQNKIKMLDSIQAAEAAEEAQKNSWSTWLMSPFSKKTEGSEEMKAQKDRARQERRIEKDMVERRLQVKENARKSVQKQLASAKDEFIAANLKDDYNIAQLQRLIQIREMQQREECERAEQQRRDEQMRQAHEEWVEGWRRARREAAEASRRQEQEAAAQRTTTNRYATHQSPDINSYSYTSPSTDCIHNGWWPKVQGRAACPECDDVWTYLLKCPGCDMLACPKCQARVRPRYQGGGGEARARRAASPEPVYDWDW